MTKTKQQKLQKKAKRAKEVRKKVLARREALRAPAREARELHRRMKRIDKIQRDMGEHSVWSNEVYMQFDDKTLTQLEKNAQILKALESEYKSEVAKRDDLNADLESKGLKTLQEKLDYMHQQVVADQKAAGLEALGPEVIAQLEEQQKPKAPKKDVAEVSIVKAPGFEAIPEEVEESSISS